MKQWNKHLVCSLTALGIAASLGCGAGSGWSMDAGDAPESVTIDSLSHLYGPVEFDHAAHVAMARCTDCHHHTTGTVEKDSSCFRCHAQSGEAATVACTDCHSAEPFLADNLKNRNEPNLHHIDKPGLLGAYHLNCIGCHENVSGPTGCQDCHTMTEAGEQRFHTGKFAPAGESGGAHQEGH